MKARFPATYCATEVFEAGAEVVISVERLSALSSVEPVRVIGGVSTEGAPADGDGGCVGPTRALLTLKLSAASGERVLATLEESACRFKGREKWKAMMWHASSD
jgi:hypothetical protein